MIKSPLWLRLNWNNWVYGNFSRRTHIAKGTSAKQRFSARTQASTTREALLMMSRLILCSATMVSARRLTIEVGVSSSSQPIPDEPCCCFKRNEILSPTRYREFATSCHTWSASSTTIVFPQESPLTLPLKNTIYCEFRNLVVPGHSRYPQPAWPQWRCHLKCRGNRPYMFVNNYLDAMRHHCYLKHA